MFTVDDLAQELDVDADAVLEACSELGIVASSGSSGLSSSEHERLRLHLHASPDLPPVSRGSTERIPNPPPADDPRSLRERAAALAEKPPKKRIQARTMIRIVIYTCLLIAIGVAVVTLGDRADEPIDVPVVQRFTNDDVGTCLDFAAGRGPQVVEASCDTAHDAELLAVAQTDAADDYPGQDELEAEFEPICRDAFLDATGVAYDESALAVVFLLPTPSTWSIGDRTMLCLVEDPTAKLVGRIGDPAG